MKRALLLLMLITTAANAATIRGRVVYANGAPCSGAQAKALDPAKRETTIAYSDRDGMFYIHDVPPGRYTVMVTKNRTTKAIPINVTAAPYAEVGTVPVQ